MKWVLAGQLSLFAGWGAGGRFGDRQVVQAMCVHSFPAAIRSSCVELGKFDPPLWHAPYGRIV